MLFFTVTNVKKKGSMLLKLALVLLLVAVLLPFVHGMMLDVEAMDEMQTPLPEGAEGDNPNQPQQDPAGLTVPETPAQPEDGTVPEDSQDTAVSGEYELPEVALAEAEEEPEGGIDEEEYPGEPIRVDGELWLPLTFWQDLSTILSY